jgi:hypothetical protein
MAYLDITDPDNFVHLVQLFYAAHPRYQQDNERMRVHMGMPDEYFISLPFARDMATWARQRHFITRAAATRLLEFVAEVEHGPLPD